MNLETLLEESLAKAEAGALDTGAFYANLSTSQPEIFTFLFDEDTRLLMEHEHDYLLFLAMILMEVCKGNDVDLSAIEVDALEDMAEYNWGLLEHTSIENISETLVEHPGYVLYEFLEEATSPQKSHEILAEAAIELVYVKCKSLVDAAFMT
jgi:hypothetical protein